MRYLAWLGAALLVACSPQGGGGGGNVVTPPEHMVFQGQRLQTAGPAVTARMNEMAFVGRAADGRELYAMHGGGGGGGSQTLFIQVGPESYRPVVPEPYVGPLRGAEE